MKNANLRAVETVSEVPAVVVPSGITAILEARAQAEAAAKNLAAIMERESEAAKAELAETDAQIATLRAEADRLNEVIKTAKANMDTVNAGLRPLITKRNELARLMGAADIKGTRVCGTCGKNGHNARSCGR